ncbi:MAG: sensor histidine kinase N-terminal domain-containing protein [Gammaproteobacteria bacterium]|nr:sensor histidine kinase N-terminal domain-containing protein [Gammaproteobacteria bacterium]MBU0785351.1 sensor histidine kinase N-terminal domain-containing protein [Gammaproteobacteria bacterium]MBU0815934.1 sensor histidine kinase N-terminal domain-containing protein [Gammaproteobacteria bacterium]MBU1787473.1 sensor histidine kinase N-terminal domain-containing protein [Gammaproteobacteria bacterium]
MTDAPEDSRRPSLRARLVQHVMVPLALTWLLGTAVTVGVASFFAEKALDRALLDDAYAIASKVKSHPGGLALELSSGEMSTLLFDQSERVFFAIFREDGSVIAGHPGLNAPRPLGNSMTRFSDISYQGRELRSVALRRTEPAVFDVVVALTTGSREELLHLVLLYSVVPQLLLLALLAWWLRRVIGRDLWPFSQLQQSVNQRDALDLTPVTVTATSSDVEKLGMAINALLDRVRQSMRAQREFSGNVAHELRTPLAGIRALTEYGLAQQDPAVWREQLRRIGASEARASRLVEQLLSLALVEEAEVGLVTETIALDEIVRDTVLRYLGRADAAGVDLGVQGIEQAVRVQGNAALVEGVLGNLIDNALRYGRAPAGRASTVTVVLLQEQGAVTLSVVDNGPGLTPEEQQHLMQRGARGAAQTRLGEGAGLGLAIVSRFADVMHAGFKLGQPVQGLGLRASLTFRTAPAPHALAAGAEPDVAA